MPASCMSRHQSLEFTHLLAIGDVRGVGRVRGEKGGRLISPEIHVGLTRERIDTIGVDFLELVHRKQFDRSHAQLLEVGDLLDQAGESARVAPPRKRDGGSSCARGFRR